MPHQNGIAQQPVFHLRDEVDFGHECQMLCLLLPRDQTVDVVVNTAHGQLGYDHAAYHVYHEAPSPRVCSLDRVCGYLPNGTRTPPV